MTGCIRGLTAATGFVLVIWAVYNAVEAPFLMLALPFGFILLVLALFFDKVEGVVGWRRLSLPITQNTPSSKPMAHHTAAQAIHEADPPHPISASRNSPQGQDTTLAAP